MRSGAWLVVAFGLACPLEACSGGYPLPPTRCDRWCDATKGGGDCYGWYDPASCVSGCEQSHFGDEECQVQLDAVVACYQRNPAAVSEGCNYTPTRTCGGETDALAVCASALYLSSGPFG